MRILIDATPLQTGHRGRGVGTYTRELLRGLLALPATHDYGLIVHPAAAGQTSPVAELEPLPPHARLIYLPRPALGRFSAAASHQIFLPRLLAAEAADVFHAPGFVAAFSVPGLPPRSPQRLVVTLHDFLPLRVPALFSGKRLNRWWYRVQRARAAQADHLICVSEATRQDALAFLPGAVAARCTVIHEGVDPAVFHPPRPGDPAPPLPPDAPYILFVGGEYANKNRPAALAAFARLAQSTSLPHSLALVGRDDTPPAVWAQRIPGLDLSRIHWIAGASQAELAALYRGASLFVFPSTSEGFGLPVLEAMSSGAPVVTSALSSLPEVAGDAALLVDPHDVDALAAAMIAVLADPALHARLRAAGLARAATFTWQATARQTVRVYEAVGFGAG